MPDTRVEPGQAPNPLGQLPEPALSHNTLPTHVETTVPPMHRDSSEPSAEWGTRQAQLPHSEADHSIIKRFVMEGDLEDHLAATRRPWAGTVMRVSRQQPEAPGLPGAAARPQAPREGKRTASGVCVNGVCMNGPGRQSTRSPRRLLPGAAALGPSCRAPFSAPAAPAAAAPHVRSAQARHTPPSQAAATAIRRLPRSPPTRPPCPRAPSRPPARHRALPGAAALHPALAPAPLAAPGPRHRPGPASPALPALTAPPAAPVCLCRAEVPSGPTTETGPSP